jgi:hypothetical protein
VVEQQPSRAFVIAARAQRLDLRRAGHGVGPRRDLDVSCLEEPRPRVIDVAAQLLAVAEERKAEVVEGRRSLGRVPLDPGAEAGNGLVEPTRGHQARTDRVHLHQVRRVMVPALLQPRHRTGSRLQEGFTVLVQVPAARLHQGVPLVAVPLDQRVER